MSFDEGLLDDPDRLQQRDEQRLLWSLATAGAQVRRAAATIGEFGLERLRDTDLPRALLVATDAPSAVAGVLTRLSGSRTPAVTWHGAELPRWAGPADALLIGSLDGRHPRLATLAAQGAQRGLAMAVVAPATGPVAAAVAGRAPLHELARDLHPWAARWAVLTPMLQALDVLGVAVLPGATLVEIASALDAQAEACRPDSDAFTNPAKSLAIEFASTTPLVAGAGLLAGAAARTIADALQQIAGVPAVSVGLPDGVARAAALLRGAGPVADDDLFRDRSFDDGVDGPVEAWRPRLLVIGDDGTPDDPLLGERSDAQMRLGEVAARRAAATLHELAAGLGMRSSGVDVPDGDPLARFAAATAFGDFTAAYLALGRGVSLHPGQWSE